MNIDSLTRANPVDRTAAVRESSSPAATPATSVVRDPKPSFSDAAKKLADLEKLKTSDPSKFQETMKQMSSDLRSKAEQIGGRAGSALSAMADKIESAAKTGDLSGLKPPSGAATYGKAGPLGGARPAGPPPGGQAGGGGGGSGSVKSASSGSSDPADTNSDGKVSSAERFAYDAAHPKAEADGKVEASGDAD
jgi:hypothetical protein